MKILCNISNSDEFKIDTTGKSIKGYCSAKRRHDKSSVAIKSSEELFDSFDEWYHSDSRYDDDYDFIDTLESLLYNSPDYEVVSFFDEPSTQGMAGTDEIWIGLSNEDSHAFYFDWHEQLFDIYQYGPVDAAQKYFAIIDQGIKDGTSLV